MPNDDAGRSDSGLIDSLGLVTLIAEIEREFQFELPLDDFDLAQFRGLNRIAEFVSKAALEVT